MQLPTPGKVDQDGGGHGPAQKGEQPAQTAQGQVRGPQHQIVGHGRDDAGHVGGVLLHGQKAPSIGSTGHEGQGKPQMSVGVPGAFTAGQPAGVFDGHLNYRTTLHSGLSIASSNR